MDTPTPPQRRPSHYTLRDTDTLATVAERHDVTLQMLDAANPEQQLSVRRIDAGQTLVIPPAPMSATEALPGRNATAGSVGSNAAFITPSTAFSVRSEVGGQSRTWEWNPGAGSVKGAAESGAPLPGLRDPRVQGVAGGSLEHAVAQGPDGRFTVKLTSQADVGVTAEDRRNGLEVEAGARTGTRVQYAVALPADGLDRATAAQAAARVDPFNPSTLPVGGTVTMNGQDFSETSLQASFTRAGTGLGPMTRSTVLDAQGTGYAITRTDGNSVQVVVGPNRAIEAYNGIGITSSVATAMAGRQDTLGSAELQTARFDVSTPDGQAAFTRFLRDGEIQPDAPGVSGMSRVERVDFSSSSRLDLGLGPEQLRLQAQLAGPENSGSSIRTTYPDGSSSLLSNLQYGGGVPLRVEQRFDAGGNELGHLRSYQFEVDTRRPEYGFVERWLGRDGEAESRNMAGNLNAALRGDAGAQHGPVAAGDKVTLAFDERQMRTLMAQTRAGDDARQGAGGWDWLQTREAHGQPVDTMEFAVAMARRMDGDPYRFAQSLYETADRADGRQADGNVVPLDARVLGADGRVLHAPARAAMPEDAGAAGPAPLRDGGDASAIVERLRVGAQDGPDAFRQALEDIRATGLGRQFEERAQARAQEERRAEDARSQDQEQAREERSARQPQEPVRAPVQDAMARG